MRDALDELPEDEAELAQAESLLRALGARDDADISLLVSKFFSDGPADTGRATLRPSLAAGSNRKHGRSRPVASWKNGGGMQLSKPPAAEPHRCGAVGLARGTQRRTHAKQREYWTKMANVVSDDTFELRQELEKQLEKYNTY